MTGLAPSPPPDPPAAQIIGAKAFHCRFCGRDNRLNKFPHLAMTLAPVPPAQRRR